MPRNRPGSSSFSPSSLLTLIASEPLSKSVPRRVHSLLVMSLISSCCRKHRSAWLLPPEARAQNTDSLLLLLPPLLISPPLPPLNHHHHRLRPHYPELRYPQVPPTLLLYPTDQVNNGSVLLFILLQSIFLTTPSSRTPSASTSF